MKAERNRRSIRGKGKGAPRQEAASSFSLPPPLFQAYSKYSNPQTEEGGKKVNCRVHTLHSLLMPSHLRTHFPLGFFSLATYLDAFLLANSGDQVGACLMAKTGMCACAGSCDTRGAAWGWQTIADFGDIFLITR